ncbi:MAG: M23 family metallopeptidase [Prolixibacteraceae bacterium]|nr:M23 family metallopeptidase [Prolixibacteraceae bacterium]
MEKNKKQKWLDKLKNRYRLIVYNDTSLQSVWTMKLTRLKVFTLVSLIFIVIIVLVIFLIAGTNLKEFIPGYPRAEYREMIIHNALVVDSLTVEIERRDRLMQTLKAIMRGEDPPEYILPDDTANFEPISRQEIEDAKSLNYDSIFYDKIVEESLSLSINGESISSSSVSLSNVYFFQPIKGIITNSFNSTKNHYGIDLVASPNTRISSVLSGTVFFSDWTPDTGYVIMIQHESSLISIYKHNASLLKKAGDKVNGGEAIAVIGNTGELSTGAHLHFELWHLGSPVDPEQYIVF